MLDNETLRGILGLGFFVGVGGLLLIFLQPPGTAEQVLSACSAIMGAVLIGGVVLLSHIRRRKA